MTTAAQLAAIRLIIEAAPIVPPAPERRIEPAPEPLRLRKLPIGLLGIGQATVGEDVERYGIAGLVFAYIDSRGCRRMLSAEQHSRAGIASLFLLQEHRLSRLWPAATTRGRWDHDRAAEELIGQQGHIGLYRPKRGEPLVPEAAGTVAAHARLTRSALRRLRRGDDPYCVLALLAAENAARCRPPLSQPDITRLVEAVCKQLVEQERHRAHG